MKNYLDLFLTLFIDRLKEEDMTIPIAIATAINKVSAPIFTES